MEKMTRIRTERIAKGLTLEDMGKVLGITSVTYRNYEIGKRQVPEEIAIKISQKLGLSLEDIFLPEKYSAR